MLKLSPEAAKEIGRLKLKQPENVLFRLAVKPGGCAGWFYDMSFDAAIATDDQIFDCHGLQVIIDPESLNYLDGLLLDYSEDLMGGGFRFNNPIAHANCSCGNSFSIMT
ncbi:HesB/IscA family protein [Iningainema tapete]|uniref:Iron-sulfur cluster assembly accessory protein n=1 Tax=Iningainema tapete BLCC-T55 TaxID=2748662 RepID=A0A8J7BY30_9CYAN|nr:iron-sulfur cluster assembly accessory protein [Iningainema tapete]MBD2774917.1 iron-sulfur cluster assembly accessory protein [Iningainema tapete BLCC-T55]